MSFCLLNTLGNIDCHPYILLNKKSYSCATFYFIFMVLQPFKVFCFHLDKRVQHLSHQWRGKHVLNKHQNFIFLQFSLPSSQIKVSWLSTESFGKVVCHRFTDSSPNNGRICAVYLQSRKINMLSQEDHVVKKESLALLQSCGKTKIYGWRVEVCCVNIN